MMIRIAWRMITGQRAIGKRRMLSLVEHHFIFRRAVQRRINRQPRLHVGLPDGRGILRPCHEQPGNLNVAERSFRARRYRCARTEDDRGANASIS